MSRFTCLVLIVLLWLGVVPPVGANDDDPLLVYDIVGYCGSLVGVPDVPVDTLTEDTATAARLLGYRVAVTFDDPNNVWTCDGGKTFHTGNRIEIWAPGSKAYANTQVNSVLGSLDYDTYAHYTVVPAN